MGVHIFYLFAELFLTKLVQCEELLSQNNILDETTASEFDTHNDL